MFPTKRVIPKVRQKRGDAMPIAVFYQQCGLGALNRIAQPDQYVELRPFDVDFHDVRRQGERVARTKVDDDSLETHLASRNEFLDHPRLDGIVEPVELSSR